MGLLDDVDFGELQILMWLARIFLESPLLSNCVESESVEKGLPELRRYRPGASFQFATEPLLRPLFEPGYHENRYLPVRSMEDWADH